MKIRETEQIFEASVVVEGRNDAIFHLSVGVVSSSCDLEDSQVG